jgi:acyl-CoA reductase-like NAD-dependent aldehyde dehydrogenase
LKLKNPKDTSLITSDLHEASAADCDKAVDFAAAQFDGGEWSKYPGNKRGACLNKLADLIDQHAEEIAYFESIATGRPISFVLSEIPRVSDVYRCKER